MLSNLVSLSLDRYEELRKAEQELNHIISGKPVHTFKKQFGRSVELHITKFTAPHQASEVAEYLLQYEAELKRQLAVAKARVEELEKFMKAVIADELDYSGNKEKLKWHLYDLRSVKLPFFGRGRSVYDVIPDNLKVNILK